MVLKGVRRTETGFCRTLQLSITTCDMALCLLSVHLSVTHVHCHCVEILQPVSTVITRDSYLVSYIKYESDVIV